MLDGARVPVANRLGEEGDGFRIAMAGLDGGRLNIAAASLGGAQSAFDKALSYMKERKAFGQPLTGFQALQFTLADMAANLEICRTFLWRAASALEERADDATTLRSEEHTSELQSLMRLSYAVFCLKKKKPKTKGKTKPIN